MAFWRKDKHEEKKVRKQREQTRRLKEYQGDAQNVPDGEQVPPISRKDKW